jgi:hypothetical protein
MNEIPRKSDRPSAEENLSMEISDDRRLREVGIDPNGDLIGIVTEVARRAGKLKGRGRKQKSRLKLHPPKIVLGPSPPASSPDQFRAASYEGAYE